LFAELDSAENPQLTESHAAGHGHQPHSLLFAAWLSTDNWQLNSLTHQPLHFTSLHFTSLHFTQLNCTRPEVIATTDPTENTAFSISLIVVTDGCIVIAGTLMTYLQTVTNQRMLILTIVAQQRYYRLHYFSFKVRALSRVGNKLGNIEGL
jgi:hypothetical protein